MIVKYLSIRLLILPMLFSLVNCKGQYTKWEYDKTISQIEFTKIRSQLLKKDTVLIIGLLKNESIISGFSCGADWVHFDKKWNLLYFKLANSFELKNAQIQKDTWVSLEKKGRYICFLPKDTIIQGYLCMSGNKGAQTNFDIEGNLRSFFSPTDIKINNIFCSGGKSDEIGLLKNGSLEFCRLSIDQQINDVIYKSGSIVSFDYNGNVSNVIEK